MITATLVITTVLTAIIIAVAGLFKNGKTLADLDIYQVITTIIVAAGIGVGALFSGATISDGYVAAGIATAAQIGLTNTITDILKGLGILKRTQITP